MYYISGAFQKLLSAAKEQQIDLDQRFGQDYLSKDKGSFAKCFWAVMEALKELKETLNHYYQNQFQWRWEEKLRREQERQEKIAQEVEAKQKEEEEANARQTAKEEVQPKGDIYLESQFSGYGSLDDFARTALELEKLLNPFTRWDEPQNIREALLKIEGKLIVVLQQLTQSLDEHMKYMPSLQARRLMNTMEYELINSYGSMQLKGAAVAFERAWKNHKPMDIAQKVLDEKEGRERAQLKLLHNEIILIWDISEEHFIKEWNVLQIGRHGTARGSAPATWVQKEGAFGELMLCKPMIIHINNVAPDDLVIYEWEPDQLIIQILQGTTRRYKVLTLLECVIKIHDVKDELIICTKQNRITTEAWSSLTQCIGGYLLEGVSAKAKEQTRQITTLLSLLNKKPELICTGYEVLASQAFGSEIRIDMVFKNQSIVIEIEGLPASKSKAACAYLKERYMIKFKTLEQWLCEQNCQLILMVPAGTQIPADQQDEINKDQTIIIWKDQ